MLLDQLPEVDDGRLVAGEEGLEPLGVPLVGQPLLALPGFGGSARASASRSASASSRLLRHELVDVDPRRHLEHALDVAR